MMKENVFQKIRHRWLPVIVLLGIMPPTPMICLKERTVSVTEEADIAVIAEAVEQEVWRIEQPADSKRTFPDGQLSFSGKAPLPAALPNPQTVVIVVKHFDAMGVLLETRQFPLIIKSTGVISLQKFPFAELLLNPEDQLAIALKPVGGDLGPGRIRIQWKYKAS